MPTVHFRNGRQTVQLAENPTVEVPLLIAELAEVLVATQLATQEQIAELRLAIQRNGEWEEISHSKETLQDLRVGDSTVIGYTFGADGQFEFDSYTSLDGQ